MLSSTLTAQNYDPEMEKYIARINNLEQQLIESFNDSSYERVLMYYDSLVNHRGLGTFKSIKLSILSYEYLAKSTDDPEEKTKFILAEQELKDKSLEHYGKTVMSENYSINELTSDRSLGVYTVVETQPKPPNGMKRFYQFIADNLTYPIEARRKGTEGKVFVKFVVAKDGAIEAVQAVKGIGDGCDAAAIEVISKSADWTPGENRGEKVNVMMILPITFALESNKEKKKRLKAKKNDRG